MVSVRQMTPPAAYPALICELSLLTSLSISRALATCLEFFKGRCLLAKAAVVILVGSALKL